MPRRRYTRRQKRLRRTRKKPHRGGRRLTSPPFIAVYNPPLRCAGNLNAPYHSSDYIGKEIQQIYEPRFNQIKSWLASIDPTESYTVPPILTCTLASEQENTNYKKELKFQEIQKYAGVSLEDRLKNTSESLEDILLPLEPFLRHLSEFNKGFLHRDLHTGNIVWDGSTYKMIDFELMSSRDYEKETLNMELANAYERNNKNTTSEEFETEVERQIDLVMQNLDLNTLITSIGRELEDRIEQRIFIFVGKMHVAPWLDLISPFSWIRDYNEAFTELFSALRE